MTSSSFLPHNPISHQFRPFSRNIATPTKMPNNILPSHTQPPPNLKHLPQLTHRRLKQIIPSQPNPLSPASTKFLNKIANRDPRFFKRALVSIPPILHPLLPFKVRDRKNNRDLLSYMPTQ
ncbi:hypothetical protein P692DRAFT_20876502 [Suillus brevipes Sb2]|nr:hypothetical protein P692DRAFT_20876502 [Suillus brevipes Sb2]